ncbi:MAG: hypothetical protein KKF56_04500 [Nanoarchaeota archaeon]|nr:hypothetical protein [Nanoarchaeota archaeon]
MILRWSKLGRLGGAFLRNVVRAREDLEKGRKVDPRFYKERFVQEVEEAINEPSIRETEGIRDYELRRMIEVAGRVRWDTISGINALYRTYSNISGENFPNYSLAA